VLPTWIAERSDGQMFPIITHFDSKRDQEATGKALRIFFKEKDVVRYVSIVEAWMIEPKTKEIPESVKRGASLAGHPDRREVIWVTAEEGDKHKVGMFYILRPEHGKAILSPFKTMPQAEKQEGIFCNLLSEDEP